MTQYHFDGLRLDTRTRRIEGPDGSVHLPPKPYEVLVELIREPGGVVSRQTLLDRVWPERPASDETLSRTVADLRKYLGDDPRSVRYIETVPKVGYRFSARVDSTRSNPLGHRIPVLAAMALAAAGIVAVATVIYFPAQHRGITLVEGGMLQAPLPLTTDIGDEDAPDFSPDGRWLVYAARSPGNEDWDIRLRDLENGETRVLVAQPEREYGPAFSPDGGSIAFLRYHGEQCQVVIKPLNGPERIVGQCRTPMMGYVDWSPEGAEIAFSDSNGQDATLVLKAVNVDTGDVRRLVSAESTSGHQFAPAYSPDGTQLAFLQGSFDQSAVWLASTETGQARPLTDAASWTTGVTWNGDGTALYVTTARPEQALWRVALDGEIDRVRPLVAYMPAHDPVHSRLVYDHIQFRTNIWSVARTGDGQWSGPVRRISSTRTDNNPSVAPDGSRVVFTSNRSGAWEVWSADPGNGGVDKLTDWLGDAMDRPAWAPDGSALVYSVQRDGDWTAYLHVLDGTRPRRLASEPGDIRHPVWSEEGNSILYAGTGGIRRLSLTAGGAELVLAARDAIPLFEKEGVVFYLRPGQPGIQRWNDDGPGKPLATAFDIVLPAAVTHAGDEIFFVAVSPEDGRRRLYSQDLASGSPRPVLPVVSDTRQANVSAAPSGRVVWFSQTDDIHSDLELLENLP